jgi:hypothetical protein
MPSKSRMSSKTQKRALRTQTRKKKSVPTTLPELKGSFDHLRKGCHEILRKTKETKQRIKQFQSLWKDIFHRPVDAMAAEAYLRVMENGVARGKTAKGRANTRKQKGGALAGAPLDFQTRPGVDGVHGSFPQYLSGGLSFYNTINQDSMLKDCGIQDITPSVPASMGSNQAGGGLLSDAAFLATTRPQSSSVPPTAIQDMQTAWSGKTLGASPLANQNQLKYI